VIVSNELSDQLLEFSYFGEHLRVQVYAEGPEEEKWRSWSKKGKNQKSKNVSL
jgi:hypothetical protein